MHEHHGGYRPCLVVVFTHCAARRGGSHADPADVHADGAESSAADRQHAADLLSLRRATRRVRTTPASGTPDADQATASPAGPWYPDSLRQGAMMVRHALHAAPGGPDAVHGGAMPGSGTAGTIGHMGAQGFLGPHGPLPVTGGWRDTGSAAYMHPQAHPG